MSDEQAWGSGGGGEAVFGAGVWADGESGGGVVREPGEGWGKEVEKALRQVMSGAIAAGGQGGGGTGGQDEREERERVREVFRRRVMRGEYGGLFDEPVRRILAEAAEEKVLDVELGALRMMLARLLMEDGDPVRQAEGVCRVATAAARIVKTGASIKRPRDTLQEWITEHLRELDREREEMLALREGGDGMGEGGWGESLPGGGRWADVARG